MPAMNTRSRIIETADTLFYENGFAATSFADIAQVVGISRGNFYHHFKTKDQILDAVISYRIDRTRTMLDKWHTSHTNPRDRIQSFVQILITNQTKIMAFGCPVGSLCTELAKMNHSAQSHANKLFSLFQNWLTLQFKALGINEQAEERALHVLAWSQGVASIATAFRDETFIHREVADITTWLDSQSPQLN